MTYRSVVVHVETGAAGEARVRCAAELADRFGARLIGCAGEALPTPPRDPFSPAGTGLTALTMDTVDQHLLRAKATFEQIAGHQRQHWIGVHSAPDEALAQAAKVADILVTGHPRQRSDAVRGEDPGLLVVIAGRPVLIAPPGADYLRASRILVCFKDSRESNRAVADALPLLKMADEVLVVEVASPPDLPAAHQRVEQVGEYLREHAVRATGEALPQDARRTASILKDRADCFGADLIVAGGYGRSRLGEWAFGGVTKSLLEQTDRFVLLSH